MTNNSNFKKNTFLQKIKIFLRNIECVLQCISDDTEIGQYIEEDIEIQKDMETNEDIFILKKNNEVFYLIGSESIKI